MPRSFPVPDSAVDRAARMDLSVLLAAHIDAARRQDPLQQPLLNWAEGDTIVQLLETLARLLSEEPLGELADELAEKLRTRLGHPPGYDPARIAAAVTDHLSRRLGVELS
ncbi:hypothetical protein [Streptosporangium subroseum]|nr:hypothetical protein [Streptosporangium subroseum]